MRSAPPWRNPDSGDAFTTHRATENAITRQQTEDGQRYWTFRIQISRSSITRSREAFAMRTSKARAIWRCGTCLPTATCTFRGPSAIRARCKLWKVLPIGGRFRSRSIAVRRAGRRRGSSSTSFADRGTIFISPVKLMQYKGDSSEGPNQQEAGWWREREAGLIGGIGGGICGLLGGLMELLPILARLRGILSSRYTVILVGIGVLSLIFGLVGLTLGQHPIRSTVAADGNHSYGVCGGSLPQNSSSLRTDRTSQNDRNGRWFT